jgi:hypothetical protein
VPHAVVRIYPEAGPLTGILRERKDEVRSIMTSVPGFNFYGIMDTGSGIVSLTVCDSQEGIDESIARAAEWIMTNSPADFKIDPPQILQGEPVIRFQAENIPESGAHVALRVFAAPAPQGLADRADAIREFMSAVRGFRSYWAIATENGGVSIISGDDKASVDAIGERMLEFVTATYPEVPPRPVAQHIEGTALFRATAQTTPA